MRHALLSQVLSKESSKILRNNFWHSNVLSNLQQNSHRVFLRSADANKLNKLATTTKMYRQNDWWCWSRSRVSWSSCTGVYNCWCNGWLAIRKRWGMRRGCVRRSRCFPKRWSSSPVKATEIPCTCIQRASSWWSTRTFCRCSCSNLSRTWNECYTGDDDDDGQVVVTNIATQSLIIKNIKMSQVKQWTSNNWEFQGH